MAVGEVDLRAIGRVLALEAQASTQAHLQPQQLGVSVQGGISILIQGIRLMLELHPTFVAVKLDLRNAYNAVSRQVVLRRLAAVPSLAHLVPFIHALWASPSDLVTDRMGSRLFGGDRSWRFVGGGSAGHGIGIVGVRSGYAS